MAFDPDNRPRPRPAAQPQVAAASTRKSGWWWKAAALLGLGALAGHDDTRNATMNMVKAGVANVRTIGKDEPRTIELIPQGTASVNPSDFPSKRTGPTAVSRGAAVADPANAALQALNRLHVRSQQQLDDGNLAQAKDSLQAWRNAASQAGVDSAVVRIADDQIALIDAFTALRDSTNAVAGPTGNGRDLIALDTPGHDAELNRLKALAAASDSFCEKLDKLIGDIQNAGSSAAAIRLEFDRMVGNVLFVNQHWEAMYATPKYVDKNDILLVKWHQNALEQATYIRKKMHLAEEGVKMLNTSFAASYQLQVGKDTLKYDPATNTITVLRSGIAN